MSAILVLLLVMVLFVLFYHSMPMVEEKRESDSEDEDSDDDDDDDGDLYVDGEDYTIGGEVEKDDIPDADGKVGEESFRDDPVDDVKNKITCDDGKKVSCAKDSLGCVDNSYLYCDTSGSEPLPFSNDLDNSGYLCKRDGNVVSCDHDQWSKQTDNKKDDDEKSENPLERGFMLLEDGIDNVKDDFEHLIRKI